VKTEVSIQSISKVFTMAQVVQEQGLEAIGRRARLAASEVRSALARLEGAGLVRRDPLGRYLRRAGG